MSWWKEAIVYQIYPRSFCDSNGDGVGDLEGIRGKLDYLKDLGINAIWISPVYPSPGKDCGYDISDYTDIDPLFGSLEVFKRLLSDAHEKGIRILMDLVINHTSDQHPWFIESREGNTNKRDWYLWHKGKNGKRPNNWVATLELTNAWWWDELRQEYYLSTFTRNQPELNWRNPEVKSEIFKVLKFWLDLGVDGFRMDVVNWYIKDDQFRDNPWSLKLFPDLFQKHIYDRNRPETHDICREIRTLADSYPGERMLVGEIFTDNAEEAASYHGKNLDELHMAFNFHFMYQFWGAKRFYKSIVRWYQALPEGAWPNFTLSNHDYIRHGTRYRWGKFTERRLRLAITMLMTLRGTPFLYYGEEIGMENTPVPKGQAMDPLERFPLIPGRARARTPMQWSPEKNAGFSSGMPWLPINQKFSKVNVETESQDPGSLLNYYKNVIELRQSNDSLRKGDFRFLLNAHADLLVYERSFEGKKAIVILNFAHKDVFIPEGMIEAGRECDFGTHGKKKGILKALEGRIYLT
jgi:alpha-glucosidase